MRQLHESDVAKVVAALPPPIQRMLRMSRFFLAGGFVRAIVNEEVPNDIDLFVPSREPALRYSRLLKASRRVTKNAITVRLGPGTPPIQFIVRWFFSEAGKVIESFDFTIAQAVVWFDGSKWQGLCADTFYIAVGDRLLRYTSPTREEDAAGSLLRVNRFIARGYNILDEDMGKVVARVVNESAGTRMPFETNEEATIRVVKQARPERGDSL